MRWFAWLVALCLLAAGGARPDALRLLDRHDATVDDASDLATLIPRRPSTVSPDKRTDRRLDLDSPPPPAPGPVAHRSLADSVERHATTSTIHAFAHSSRGPPVDRAASSHLVSS